VIIWVNGAVGSGRTTLVAELRRRMPESLVYDPEQTGFVLRGVVEVPTGDFQDLPLWRSQVAGMAIGLAREYGRPVLVPMTLVDPRYAEEIFGALEAAGVTARHFFLAVTASELEARLDARVLCPDDSERDESARAWCKAQVPRCVAAADELRGGAVLLDRELPTPELADRVMAMLG